MTHETCGAVRRPSIFWLVLIGTGGPGPPGPLGSATEHSKIYGLGNFAICCARSKVHGWLANLFDTFRFGFEGKPISWAEINLNCPFFYQIGWQHKEELQGVSLEGR